MMIFLKRFKGSYTCRASLESCQKEVVLDHSSVIQRRLFEIARPSVIQRRCFEAAHLQNLCETRRNLSGILHRLCRIRHHFFATWRGKRVVLVVLSANVLRCLLRVRLTVVDYARGLITLGNCVKWCLTAENNGVRYWKERWFERWMGQTGLGKLPSCRHKGRLMFSDTLWAQDFVLFTEVTTNRNQLAQKGRGRDRGGCLKSWESGIRLKDTKADEMLNWVTHAVSIKTEYLDMAQPLWRNGTGNEIRVAGSRS